MLWTIGIILMVIQRGAVDGSTNNVSEVSECYGGYFTDQLCSGDTTIEVTDAVFGVSPCYTNGTPPCCPQDDDCLLPVAEHDLPYYRNITYKCNRRTICDNLQALRVDHVHQLCLPGVYLAAPSDYVTLHYMCLTDAERTTAAPATQPTAIPTPSSSPSTSGPSTSASTASTTTRSASVASGSITSKSPTIGSNRSDPMFITTGPTTDDDTTAGTPDGNTASWVIIVVVIVIVVALAVGLTVGLLYRKKKANAKGANAKGVQSPFDSSKPASSVLTTSYPDVVSHSRGPPLHSSTEPYQTVDVGHFPTAPDQKLNGDNAKIYETVDINDVTPRIHKPEVKPKPKRSMHPGKITDLYAKVVKRKPPKNPDIPNVDPEVSGNEPFGTNPHPTWGMAGDVSSGDGASLDLAMMDNAQYGTHGQAPDALPQDEDSRDYNEISATPKESDYDLVMSENYLYG